MNKLIFAVIIIVVVATVSYSLYWYYYNEAKDAMSLVMPDYMLPWVPMGIYENDTNFSFNPFEENANVLWQDMFYVENNNQTVKKPFALELIINDVKNVGADVMHSGYGALKIGSNVWNPIAGAVWTTPTGTLIEMDVFSYVDRYPIIY
ncbi:MAG: hypothetical protein WAU25_01175 [Nitrososphaeraceae archaeon]